MRDKAPEPSGKAEVCKTFIPGPIPGGASKAKAPLLGCFCFGEAIHVGRLHSLAKASPVRKFAAERPPACEAAARRISLARRANFRVIASLFNKRKRNRTPTRVRHSD